MSKVGDDLVEAFQEMAAFLRGEGEVESYEIADDVLTPQKISEIRKRVASSTKAFERDFMIPARTIESYEQGRRKPDTATVALLRIMERAPEAARGTCLQPALITSQPPPPRRPPSGRRWCGWRS